MPDPAGNAQERPPDVGTLFPNSRILTSIVEDDYVMIQCLQGVLSTFELVLISNPPILASVLLQIPTKTVFQLYHTSSFLRRYLRASPTAWRYLSFRLSQPTALQPNTLPNNDPNSIGLTRLSPNYGVDQLLINIVNPFSNNLTSLELDNTAVSGSILLSTVLNRRRETLEHLSVRGCKNVSLKYHIVDWLKGFWTASDPNAPLSASLHPPQEFKNLALKSLYTYRCRHHRRRPYLPSSLTRRDSDSEPTHDVVNLCHKLGIWTDTAWCTTPGARCYRRRGYVTMRVPQDPREVWVVYDRLWRSKNWSGRIDDAESRSAINGVSRHRDGRSWEQDEEGFLGEALGTGDRGKTYSEGKTLPMHLRKSHREFVENVICHNCSADILERCEQCSVLMHCVGCRKTLCASCAFDRPYLRNQKTPESGEDQTDRFWWAPGFVVSPCSMQDQNDVIIGPGQNPPPTSGSLTPTLKFKWCCTEPVFSGGGGITFGPGVVTRDVERVRASPLPRGSGWEDPEFQVQPCDKGPILLAQSSIPEPRTALGDSEPYATMANLLGTARQPSQVPRNLCDECYNSKDWKVHCKACSVPLCLEHDFRGLRTRVCGYKDLRAEKESLKLELKLKSIRWLAEELGRSRKNTVSGPPSVNWRSLESPNFFGIDGPSLQEQHNRISRETQHLVDRARLTLHQPTAGVSHPLPPLPSSSHDRPITPDSNATASPSRESSPSPSVASDTTADDMAKDTPAPPGALDPHPKWEGCHSFLCPQYRAVGDHRRRCMAVTKECLGCKAIVCGPCLENMEKSCTCQGCSTGDSTASVDVDISQFWCPNCRWEREQDGRCKKRVENEQQRANVTVTTSAPPLPGHNGEDLSGGSNTSLNSETVEGLCRNVQWALSLRGINPAGFDETRVAALQQLVTTLRRAPIIEDVD